MSVQQSKSAYKTTTAMTIAPIAQAPAVNPRSNPEAAPVEALLGVEFELVFALAFDDVNSVRSGTFAPWRGEMASPVTCDPSVL